MNRIDFRIRGMDCIEEVAILKREICPLVGEDNLVFDILNGRMTIIQRGERRITEKEIRQIVARTGMEAIPWKKTSSIHLNSGEGDTFWQRHHRTLLCITSGIFLLIACVIQVIYHGGIIRALIADKDINPVSLIFYIGVIVTGGWFIVPKAIFALRRLRPDINMLMTIAVTGAILIGEWFEAAAVTFLFSLAILLEWWSVGRARRAIKTLLNLTPATARFISPNNDEIMEKPVEGVPIGAIVLVRPGEKIPLDGIVTKGETSVNQAPITGESVPVVKMANDEVFAGTINGDGSFEFRVTRPTTDTTLAQIIRMVEDAQSHRASSEQWVERFTYYYTPAMMILAFLIALIPPLISGGNWGDWIYQSLVILVIACPCALVISTPLSIVTGLTTSVRAGVLIKGGNYLESMVRLKAVAMDKTGTLTYGHPVVQDVIPLNGYTKEGLLASAAALEIHSTHPLARAILNRVESTGIKFTSAEDFTNIQGKGAESTIDGKRFWIGSHRLMEEKGVEDPDVHDMALRLEDAGHSLVVLGNEDGICGLISIADRIRDEARASIQRMKELGIKRIIMLTGDNKVTAQAVAEATGIDAYKAEMMPQDKVSAVMELTKEFGHVAMVGDGVNDAPALAAAAIGITMGKIGTDAAIETADITLLSDDLTKLSWLIQHSRRTLRIIKENIIFSIGIKVIFIILAVGGLATLWMAIAADMGA
ncbi:MAG: heavy metal translocating P-type ATPase, partial [Nitrospirota bacterium]